MYIKRVTLSEFGRLTGTIEFEPNRCNVICQDNEYGKTTIMDAVLYALYNFPTSGFSRDTMKPKDKYRPWNMTTRTPNVFMVELDLCDIGGRNYTLRADFSRNQPFTLHDADTRQPISLEGMTFGQRYLRMPLSSFTQAFFLRQDEREGTQKSQLVSVIEEAAASNRRDTPGNVRQALESLAAPRMSMPPLVEEPVLVKNLVKRLEEKRSQLALEFDTLRRRLDQFAEQISQQDDLDGHLDDMDSQIALLEYALLAARIRERQTLLDRYREGREAQAERSRLLEELEPYAVFDASRKNAIINSLSEWKLVRLQMNDAHSAGSANASAREQELQEIIGALPEAARALDASHLQQLRDARTIIADREEQLARDHATLQQLEQGMQQRGVPLERLEELHTTDSLLTPEDREILFEHRESRNEAQAALNDIENHANAFRDQAQTAKQRRDKFGILGSGLMVAIVALMVVGIVLLLTDNKFAGWAFLIVAAALGGFSMFYIAAMKSKIATQELEPALQGEMQLNAQSRQIREQLENIEAEYEETLGRLGITPEQVTELRQVDHWKQEAAPWMATRDSISRLDADLRESIAEISAIAGKIDPAISDEDLSETNLSALIQKFDGYLSAKAELDSLHGKNREFQSRMDSLQAELQQKQEALENLLALPEGEAHPALAEDPAAAADQYLEGIEKAQRLNTLKQEYGSVSAMTEQEAVDLQGELDALTVRQEILAESLPATDNRTMELPARAEELDALLSRTRLQREEMRESRNRGFREAEQTVNEWRTRGPELERLIAEFDERIHRARTFDDACQLAHSELSKISEEVYTQWATALNERVNTIVPLINDRYTDVAVSPDLDISVYSREAARRLETKEIQHLSKGARDQLLLAMRIAIAEFLSAHVGNLPLALDEPFAHWDDQRFAEGMRFLTRLSEKHQVIMLSCHAWRYNHLKETAPDVAEKLHFATMKS